MKIPRLPTEKLREITNDILRGAIFTSAQVRTEDIGFVFLPVLFGGLSYPVEAPEEPVSPVKPEPPIPPVKGKFKGVNHALVKALETAQENEKTARFKLSWGDTDERARDEAVASVSAAKQNLKAWKQASVAELNLAHSLAMSQHSGEMFRHIEDVQVYERELAAYVAGQQAYEVALRDWSVGKEAFDLELRETLGILYSYVDQSLPRSVNGYPIFSSVSILHKDDWIRVRAALIREQERAKDLEV